MPRRYYVQTEGGIVLGPISAEDVRAAAARGELQPQDSIRDAAHPAWRPLASVKGLTFGPPSERHEEPVTLRESVAPIIGSVKAVGRGAARLFRHSSAPSSEGQTQGREGGFNGSAEPQVAARSFDSPEEAQESALRALALMRAQGQMSEDQYEERRRQIVGTPADSTIDSEHSAYAPPANEWQRRDQERRSSVECSRRSTTPWALLAIAIPVCIFGYFYVADSGPFRRGQREQKPPHQTDVQKVIAERERAREAAAQEAKRHQEAEAARQAAAEEAHRIDPKVTLKAFFECVQSRVLLTSRSILLDNAELATTNSVIHSVEGRLIGRYWDSTLGEYNITITCHLDTNGWTLATVGVRFTGRRGVAAPDNNVVLENVQEILRSSRLENCH